MYYKNEGLSHSFETFTKTHTDRGSSTGVNIQALAGVIFPQFPPERETEIRRDIYRKRESARERDREGKKQGYRESAREKEPRTEWEGQIRGYMYLAHKKLPPPRTLR